MSICSVKTALAIPVVIENQLQQTDHDHLGKLLTYLVNLDAASAIWVSSEPRPEHARVIDWLNESTPSGISFYLWLKAEAVSVDGSAPAPLFTLQASPTPRSRSPAIRRRSGRSDMTSGSSSGLDSWRRAGR